MKLRSSHLAVLFLGLTVPATSAFTESAPADAAPKKTFPPTSNQMDHDVAEDLRNRREELEARVRTLEAREAELVAKEKAVDEQIKKLDEIRADISRIETGNQAASAEKIAKIVETVEAMSPKASAKILNELDEPLAVQALSQVTSAKLAKILSNLEPAKSARFTELLAGVSRAKRSVASTSPVAKNPEQKGGEKNEHNSNQQLPDAANQRRPQAGQ